MSKLKASPRNSILGTISDMLASAKAQGNRVDLPIFGGLGDLMLGKTPEEVNEWAYGNAPMRVAGGGTGSYIPQLQQGRADQFSDAVTTLPGIGQAARYAPKAALALANRVMTPNLRLAQAGSINPRGKPTATATRAPSSTLQTADEQNLGALVALRMQGQLGKAAEHLGVNPQQFTAAYAGDGRVLPGVVKQLNEAENLKAGLPASPGRRKILKQGLATAARASVPDAIADPLMSMAKKTALKDVIQPEIPDESIQAMLTDALTGLVSKRANLRNREKLGMLSEGYDLLGTLSNPAELATLAEEFGLTTKELTRLGGVLDSLNPEVLATKYGLPKEAIAGYFSKQGITPDTLVHRVLNPDIYADAYYGSTTKHRFKYYGFDEFQPDEALLRKDLDSIREKTRGYDGMSDEEASDMHALERIYDEYASFHTKRTDDEYGKLLGTENWEKLQERFPQELPTPRSLVEQKIDELYYGDTDDMEAPVQNMLNDYLFNLYNKE